MNCKSEDLRLYAITDRHWLNGETLYQQVEKALKGRSPLMGVCADIGHWKRVGEDPLKNLQKLSGRIKVAHLKDLTDKMEDATWGTGILPVKAFVNELKRQHFNGLISIEYDDFKSDIQEIRNSLEFLQKCSK